MTAAALAAVGVVGFCLFPGAVLRFLLVRMYPPGDPRRQELIAELAALARARPIERVAFVLQQVETVTVEGLPRRFDARRRHAAVSLHPHVRPREQRTDHVRATRHPTAAVIPTGYELAGLSFAARLGRPRGRPTMGLSETERPSDHGS